MWEVRVDGATEAGKHGPVPEVWFLRSFSVHPGRVPIMTASAKEVIAAAIYALDPAEDQDLDMDYRPIGKPYPIPWEAIAEFDSPAVKAIEDDADAILAALDAAGYVVVRREPTEAMREAARAAPLTRGIGDVGIGGIYRAMIAAQEKQG